MLKRSLGSALIAQVSDETSEDDFFTRVKNNEQAIQSEEEIFARAFVREVNNDLNDVKHSFIKIGFRLTEADEYEYYKALGYQTIVELAEAEFGFKQTTTYDLMRVYELAHDKNNRLQIAKFYDKFSYSQLRALTRLKYAGTEVWDIVKPTDSVRALERFVSNWNEEYRYGCGYHPELKTVQEYLEAYDKRKAEKKAWEAEYYAGQLPGQMAIEPDEPSAESEELELSTRVENSEEINPVSEEPGTVPTKNEVIEFCLKNINSEIKFKLYERYFIESEFAEYIKTLYKFKGFRIGRYRCGGDDKIIYFEYQNEQYTKTIIETELAYCDVAKRILEYISFDEYLTDEEKKLYMQWEAERDGSAFETPSEEAPSYFEAEPEDIPDVGNVIEIEPEEQSAPPKLTNREYLATLRNDEFVSEICLKIIRIFPMGGKSSQFMSTVQSKLVEWLSEPVTKEISEMINYFEEAGNE